MWENGYSFVGNSRSGISQAEERDGIGRRNSDGNRGTVCLAEQVWSGPGSGGRGRSHRLLHNQGRSGSIPGEGHGVAVTHHLEGRYPHKVEFESAIVGGDNLGGGGVADGYGSHVHGEWPIPRRGRCVQRGGAGDRKAAAERSRDIERRWQTTSAPPGGEQGEAGHGSAGQVVAGLAHGIDLRLRRAECAEASECDWQLDARAGEGGGRGEQEAAEREGVCGRVFESIQFRVHDAMSFSDDGGFGCSMIVHSPRHASGGGEKYVGKWKNSLATARAETGSAN